MSPDALAPTSKIESFLSASDAPTPFVVVDIDVVEERYRQLVEAIPSARVYYAVKANPGAPILERLAALGSAFDVASPAVVEMCLASGVNPRHSSYGTTIKMRRDIANAAACGVLRVTVDSDPELEKVPHLGTE